MTDPVAYFREVAAAHPRCFWLDGGGAREWSGRRSLIGWLDPADVSLTYSATTRQVRRHHDGVAEVVGDDIFAALGHELASGGEGDQWFGYFGYACRPDLPGDSGPRPVRTRCGCVRATSGSSTTSRAVPVAPAVFGVAPRRPRPDAVPADYRTGFEQVQEELQAGNSYEVNLTHRLDTASDLAPVEAYLRLRELNPAPYAGFLQHDVAGPSGVAAELLARALRAGRCRPDARDQADQGHHPARRRRRGRRTAADAPGRRAEVPQREPDDRRPAPQRPVDGLRARHRRGAGADGRRVLRHRPPARLHRARSPA